MSKELQIIKNLIDDMDFLEIENWQTVAFDDILQNKSSLKKASGIYSIFDEKGTLLYIGKAKEFFNRLKSHLYATQGKEKSPAWKQFFEYFQGNKLIAHYYVVDGSEMEDSEKVRYILEAIIALKHQPAFEKIYSKGHYRIDQDVFEKNMKELGL